jgi:N-acetylneuraminic acid mutarotase
MRPNDDKKKPQIVRTSSFALLLLMMGVIAVLPGCTKDTDDDDDLVGNWARRSEFEGYGRTEAVTFTIGNKVYIGGGYDGHDERLTDFWEFDEPTGTWIPKAPFPGTPRNSAVAFSINGKGYVGTGIDEFDNKLKDFWEYDPSTNVWSRKADFSGTARYNAVGFSVGDKGYLSTGYDGNYLKDLWEYTPGATSADSGTWTQRASITGSKRTEASVFVHNNLAYIVGGFNNGTYVNDFWVYNPTANSWSEKRKISSVNDDADYDDDYGENIRRSNAVAFVMGNKAFLTCGNRNGVDGSTWAYNIDDDTWSQKTSFEGSAREGALAFTVNGKSFVVTGSNSSYYFDDLWEFLPEADQSDNDN